MSRLDVFLTEKGFAPTRTKAQELIKDGKVFVDGTVQTKTGQNINESQKVVVLESEKLKYVSRAGLKLEKAIDVFKIDLNGKTVLDIGSSTGGFTDCSLKHGAKKVIACDVGTNVMDKTLRQNEKVELHEQTNIKNLEKKCFETADVIVCDVSFISLEKIFEKLAQESTTSPLIALIKPQFECGMEIAKKFKGVILNKAIHIDVINKLIKFANSLGFYLADLDFSPIKGGDGNIEYISLFSQSASKNSNIDVEKIVENAFI